VGRADEASKILHAVPFPEAIDSAEDLDLGSALRGLAFFLGDPRVAGYNARVNAAMPGDDRPERRLAVKLYSCVTVSFKVGEFETGRRLAKEGFEEARTLGNTFLLAVAHFDLCIASLDGDPAEALAHAEEAERLATRVGTTFWARHATSEAAALAVGLGDVATARVRVSRACRQLLDAGDLLSLWVTAHHVALLLHLLEREDEARTVWNETARRNVLEATHHQKVLTELLGAPGESRMSDREFTKYLKDLVDDLDAESAASPAP